MDCGLFGVRFLFLGHKNGAAAPVDYLSTFATAPLLTILICIHVDQQLSLAANMFILIHDL